MGVPPELERLAWFLDSSIRLPGGYRIGLDGLIGLVPGVGDALGAAFSFYIVARASELDLPRSVLARMIFNVALETAVGSIPVLGDLFDFVYKANRRNVALLSDYAGDARRVRRSSRLTIAGVVLVLVAALIGLIWLAVALVRWIAGSL